jgi:DNA-binding PadR family transcriptional regulator
MAIATDSETEPNPEPVEEPETAPETALDSGELDIEAEVLFQVAHYKEEYGGPASMADIAFEIQEKDSELHDAIMDAVKEGTTKVKPALKSLVDQGLIVETEYGGYVATEEGEKMVREPETQAELGDTYESEKHKGNPADETSEEYELEPSDEDKDKDEMGVPFLNEA